MAWETAADVLNDAALELGLIDTEMEDPYASTDPNIIQLRQFLKRLGRDLLRDHQWTHLQKVHTITTESDTSEYDLPADFSRLIDDTAWNRTTDFPLMGPGNPQVWQQLKAIDTQGLPEFIFRIYGNAVHLHPVPTGVYTLAFEYQSTYWVQPDGQDAATTDAPTAGTDSLLFDAPLLLTGVQFMFLSRKGFDSAAAENDFRMALARAKGGDGAAPVLSLVPSKDDGILDGRNAPASGFGFDGGGLF